MTLNPLADPSARLIIAHRGASAEAPENTLAAFDLAARLGVDAFELDVRKSADDVPVVMHDRTVTRTTALRGRVAAHSAADLARAGVPALADVLEAFPSMPVLVEVKEPGVQALTAEVIRRANARGRCVVASEYHVALAVFRTPAFLVAASGREITRAWLSAQLRIRPEASRSQPYVCASVPRRHRGVTIPTRRFVRMLHARGIAVHVWTVDDEARALALWAHGVNGILTNNPRQLLPARPRW